ncbi:MAG: ArsR family transcriptional regulator, partial [Halanaerobiales bacterium]
MRECDTMELIEILKALAHENRLRILNLLRKQPLCVCEIKTLMGIGQSN